MEESVGARIQRIAKEQGLPLGKSLAGALGVKYESLRLWTAGDTAPSRKRAKLIADYLKVSVEMVMYGSTEAATRSPEAIVLGEMLDRIKIKQDRDAVSAVCEHLCALAIAGRLPPAIEGLRLFGIAAPSTSAPQPDHTSQNDAAQPERTPAPNPASGQPFPARQQAKR